MPNIQYAGIFDGVTTKAIHVGHHETLYLHLLVPAIEALEVDNEDELLRDMDSAMATWAIEELLTVGFVSIFHLWERQLREFIVEQSSRPNIEIPNQQARQGIVSYARKIMEYFDQQIEGHIWAELERAVDVVNAFKHGPGRKFDKAMECHPAYFYVSEDESHLPMVSISRHQFSLLLKSVETFWSDLQVDITP